MPNEPISPGSANGRDDQLAGRDSGRAAEPASAGAAASTALRDVTLVFAAVTAASAAISFLQSVPALAEYVHLLTGLVFLYAALTLAQRDPRGVRHHGLDLGGLLVPPEEQPSGLVASLRDLATAVLRAIPAGLRESLPAIGTALVVFPPFACGFYFWHAPARAFALNLPDSLWWYFIVQLLVVGLPEEALFRGYFQTRLADRFVLRVNVLGVAVFPVALAFQAVLFALVHFAVDLNPARLAVFFPALLFGFLRAWRGGIGAAMVFHALCNVFSDILVRGWL